MARLARVVIPGMLHHVTQRGNRRQQTFFMKDDYSAYLDLMAEHCREEGVAIWAYCLMPNHIHLIAVPETEQALRRAIGEAHRRYTRRINFREKWRGYLWQGRFASFVMDEPYLLAAARYVEFLSASDDRLVAAAPLLAIIDDWRTFLDSAIPEKQLDQLRDHGRTGRPLGDATFLQRLEELIGRILLPKKPGRKPKFPK